MLLSRYATVCRRTGSREIFETYLDDTEKRQKADSLQSENVIMLMLKDLSWLHGQSASHLFWVDIGHADHSGENLLLWNGCGLVNLVQPSQGADDEVWCPQPAAGLAISLALTPEQTNVRYIAQNLLNIELNNAAWFVAAAHRRRGNADTKKYSWKGSIVISKKKGHQPWFRNTGQPVPDLRLYYSADTILV